MDQAERRPAMWIPGDCQFSLDWELYQEIADPSGRTLARRLELRMGEGKAWPVVAGQVCRVTVRGGSQVGDLNLWNLQDPREHFWAARTRQFHGTHLTTRDRLWSTLPNMRPIATVTADTIDYEGDADGGRCHDLLGTRCDPYVSTLIAGRAFDHHCHSNLVRAIFPFGLGEHDVHDVLNMFQVTGLREDGMYWIGGSPGREGDYMEFLAEINLLVAISACPAGDVSGPPWGLTDADLATSGGALAVEVYDVAPARLANWQAPRPLRYAGMHGVSVPETAT
ncbi:MAG: urea carboxylase-associated family protein [Nocardioidaceae bacterium]